MAREEKCCKVGASNGRLKFQKWQLGSVLQCLCIKEPGFDILRTNAKQLFYSFQTIILQISNNFRHENFLTQEIRKNSHPNYSENVRLREFIERCTQKFRKVG